MHTKKNNHQKFIEYIEKGRFVLPYVRNVERLFGLLQTIVEYV